MSRLKSIGLNVLKMALTGALLVSLIAYGKLDFSQLGIFWKRPDILAYMIASWIIAVVFLGTFRWQLLLKGAGYVTAFFQTVKLQLVGLFFNSAMPGAVGGDLIKVVYVIRENPTKGKSPAMMTILLDRVIGLFGLFTVGFLVMSLDFAHVWESSLLRPLFFITTLVLTVLAISFFLVAARWKEGKDPFLKLLNQSFPGASALKKIYEAFRLYHHNIRYLVYCWLISITIQCVQFLLFFQITCAIASPDAQLVPVATVFPVGILTTAIPLAPGGLGVGHVAFVQLFDMIHLPRGADVFNVFTLGQLCLNMIGCLPYLLMRRKDPNLGSAMPLEAS